MLGLQIDHHVGVDVTFYAVVAVFYDFFPDVAVSDFVTQGSPFLVSEGFFAFFGFELHDGVQDGQVEAPYFDPS